MTPMTRMIALRYQQSLSMLLSIICFRRRINRKISDQPNRTILGAIDSSRLQNVPMMRTHTPTNNHQQVRATIGNVLVNHMYWTWMVDGTKSNNAVRARMSCVHYCCAHIFRCSLETYLRLEQHHAAICDQDRIMRPDEGQGRRQRDFPQLNWKVCLEHQGGRWQDLCWL